MQVQAFSYQAISKMPEYANKSFEELRCEHCECSVQLRWLAAAFKVVLPLPVVMQRSELWLARYPYTSTPCKIRPRSLVTCTSCSPRQIAAIRLRRRMTNLVGFANFRNISQKLVNTLQIFIHFLIEIV